MIVLHNPTAKGAEATHILLQMPEENWGSVQKLVLSPGGWKRLNDSKTLPLLWMGYHGNITDPEVTVLERLCGQRLNLRIWKSGPTQNWQKNLFNPLVHCWKELSQIGQPELSPSSARQDPPVPWGASAKELSALWKDMPWGFSDHEILAIWQHAQNLGRPLSRIEIETIAQTWSEHCKHKIFAGKFVDQSSGRDLANHLFKTYLVPTAKIPERLKDLVSVFTDNAGIVKLNDSWNYAIKVETHNSPCAKEPYGGAMTGVGGVVRDILGTGLGCQPVAAMDVFCFPSPESSVPLKSNGQPSQILDPGYLRERVRQGVQDYGNALGVPTVAGAVVTDDSYFAKPLVYVGCVGIQPAQYSAKNILAGDAIVMVGGAVGRDGIHGATMSSIPMGESVPGSMVQIGEPWLERNCWDLILHARDQGWIRAITDNGAGGLSSSVGEMAKGYGEEMMGAEVYLDRVPLKDSFLSPFEIWVSESQERMTLAMDPQYVDVFCQMASQYHCQAAQVGVFKKSGLLQLYFKGELVGSLDLHFLHQGCPQKIIKVSPWRPVKISPDWQEVSLTPEICDRLVSQPNVRSRRSLTEQYDHEVQGNTVKKPYEGPGGGPSDGSIIQTPGGLLGMGLGIQPKYSRHSARLMTAMAFSEAVANALVCGVDPRTLVALDNYCWPDCESDSHRAYDLLESVQELSSLCLHYKIPLVSGKDSMKNNWADPSLAIIPTLLITMAGKVPDLAAVRPNYITKPGLWIYLLSPHPWQEVPLGYSELANVLPQQYQIPQWRLWCPQQAARLISQSSGAKDVSEGGIIAAVAEMCWGGGVGFETSLPMGLHWGAEAPGQFVLAFDQPIPETNKTEASQLMFLGRSLSTQIWLGPDGFEWNLDQAKAKWESGW